MRVVLNDGGRAEAGFKGSTGDCVCRSIAIATGKPYREVYDELHAALDEYTAEHRDKVAKRIASGGGRRGTTPRNGISPKVFRPYLERLGWKWTPTMRIGSGCKVHLTDGELPMGRLIVQVSKHMTAVINGVIHDTYDPQWATIWYKLGTTEIERISHRCVYGYFSAPTS